MSKHYSAMRILSYGAIFNFINGARNIGKSWIFKYRSLFRAKNTGRATYWVRRFDEEVKKTVEKFLPPKFCAKYGLSMYHKTNNPTGNVKQVGRKIYIWNKNNQWNLAVEFIALSDYQNYRSADDDRFDTIVFDEYTTTDERYKFYRGNEAQDFIDLYISLKREGKMRCFFLGNKETVSNPYFRYFGIQPLPFSFQGIKTYKHGAIAVEQVNDAMNSDVAYDSKLLGALENTPYLAYLVEGKSKNDKKVTYVELQDDARFYGQFERCKMPVAIYRQGSLYIFDNRLRLGFPVYVDTTEQRYPLQRTMTKSLRNDLWAIKNAVIDNRIAFTTPVARENSEALIKWICCL